MKDILKIAAFLFIMVSVSCSNDDQETPPEAKQLPVKRVTLNYYEPDGNISTTQIIDFSYEQDYIKTMAFTQNGKIRTKTFTYDVEGRITKLVKEEEGSIIATTTINYTANNFTVIDNGSNGTSESEFIYNESIKGYDIFKNNSKTALVSYDALENIVEVNNTPYLVITKTVNTKLKSLYYKQHKLFSLFNIYASEDFFTGVIFGNNTIDKVTYVTNNTTLELIAANETSEEGITKLSLTNKASNKLYLEAKISY